MQPTPLFDSSTSHGPCLTEQLTLDFIARGLGDTAEASVRAHMDACSSCRRLVAETARGADDSAAPEESRRSSTHEPTRIGRYVLGPVLGSGAMGVVYRAHDPELDRDVALKLLLPELHEDVAGGDGQLRLQREARAMARLAHPNVVSVFDIGTVGEQWFVAMELVVGQTLTQWIDATPRAVDDVVAVFTQAGRGLAAAHAIGLVHRDFKPDNVLVGTDGRPRVTDFGLARRAGAVLGAGFTSPLALDKLGSISRSGTIAGTPGYMAPEQFLGGPVSPQTNQFSFCVALWQALHHERPFDGADLPSMAAAALDGRLRSPRSPLVPAHLTQALTRGLKPSASARFASMDELLSAMNSGRDRGPHTPTARPRRSWAVPLASGAALLGAALLVGLRSRPTDSHALASRDTPPLAPPPIPEQAAPSVAVASVPVAGPKRPELATEHAVPKAAVPREPHEPAQRPATTRSATAPPVDPFDLWK